MDLSELQTMRDDLVRARAKGVRRLRINGEEVEYKTDAEMANAIRNLEQRIARAAGSARRRVINPETRNGWR